MKLWDFIEGRLNVLGCNEQLLINSGISPLTINRIKHGGVIKDGTKQKIALALVCSVGDINAALAQKEEPKANVPPEVKEVVDGMLDEIDNIVGRKVTRPDPEKIPVKESALKYNMEQLKEETAMPEPGTLRVQKIKWYPNQPAVQMTVDGYKAHLKNMLLKMMLAGKDAFVSDLYREFGQAVAREILGENDADIRKSV
jgi:hypothetical protein